MRLLTLTIIAAVTFVCSASAQVPYSDRQPLLKRRPFAPGSVFTAPPVELPGWAPPWPYAPPARWPIASPYSMIHWDWLPKRPVEALPAPVPPGARPPMPPPLPPKPGAPAAAPPVRPTFLPAEGT